MKNKTCKPAVLLIRRIAAIALVLLSVGALFWPSAIALGGTLGAETREDIEDFENQLDKIEDDDLADDQKAAFVHAHLQGLIDLQLEKAIEDDKESARDLCETLSRMIGLLHEEPSVQKVNKAFLTKLYGSFRDLGLSFEELREIISKLPYYANKVQKLSPADEQKANQLKEDLEYYENERKLVKLGAIIYNVLFFLVIVLAAAAVVMMILNRSRAMAIIYAIFASLFGLLAVAAWVLMLIGGNDILLPHVSAFALPVLSIAACILYRRGKCSKSAPVKHEDAPVPPVEQYDTQAPVAFEDVPTPAEPPVEQYRSESPAPADGWVCPVCMGTNAVGAKYCGYCGAPMPAPEPEPEPEPEPTVLICPNCHTENELSAKFCVCCGTKLQ